MRLPCAKRFTLRLQAPSVLLGNESRFGYFFLARITIYKASTYIQRTRNDASGSIGQRLMVVDVSSVSSTYLIIVAFSAHAALYCCAKSLETQRRKDQGYEINIRQAISAVGTGMPSSLSMPATIFRDSKWAPEPPLFSRSVSGFVCHPQ